MISFLNISTVTPVTYRFGTGLEAKSWHQRLRTPNRTSLFPDGIQYEVRHETNPKTSSSQSRGQMHRNKQVIWAFYAVAIVLISTIGCDSRRTTGPRFYSYSNLYRIGTAINRYKYEHQKLPQGFSDLVPKYIPFDQINIFYVTNKYAKYSAIPSKWPSDASLLDQFASYTYVGTNGTDVIAFEKFDLWKPGCAEEGKLAVLFSDFHVQYVSVSNLQGLLSNRIPLENGVKDSDSPAKQ